MENADGVCMLSVAGMGLFLVYRLRVDAIPDRVMMEGEQIISESLSSC